MFTKKTILPIITFVSLLVSFNKSNGMNTGLGMSIGPSSLLVIEKPISLGIIKPLRYISSKSISGIFFLRKYLLRKYKLLLIKNKKQPLFIACKNNWLEIVQELLKHPNIDINKTNDNNETPLVTACYLEKLKIVKELLKHKNIDLNKSGKWGRTPFFTACYWNRLKIVKELLKHKNIDFNKSDKCCQTPFFIACCLKNLKIIKELLKHKNIDLNKPDKWGQTPFFIACCLKNLKIIKELLKHKNIDFNKPDNIGQTPLFIACKRWHLKVVKELLRHQNIDINKPNANNKTPLVIACQEGNLEIIKELLKHPKIDLSKPGRRGKTPLFRVCKINPPYTSLNKEKIIIAKLLLQNDVKIDKRSEEEAKKNPSIKKYFEFVKKFNQVNILNPKTLGMDLTRKENTKIYDLLKNLKYSPRYIKRRGKEHMFEQLNKISKITPKNNYNDVTIKTN